MEEAFLEPHKYCESCPKHAECGSNATLNTLTVPPLYWRDSEGTSSLYECNSLACQGSSSGQSPDEATISSRSFQSFDSSSWNEETGPYCLENHTGPLCEVCVRDDQYFDYGGGRCYDCPPVRRIAFQAIVLIHSIIAILSMGRAIISRLPKLPNLTNTLSLQAKVKIFISFFQIITTLQPIYGVELDDNLKKWLDFFNVFGMFYIFELIELPKSCIGSMTTQLFIGATWPYIFLFIILVFIHCVTFLRQCVPKGNGQQNRSISTYTNHVSAGTSKAAWFTSLYATVVLLYFVLPMVSQGIFDAIKCKAFDTDDTTGTTHSYLIADLSIRCSTEDDKTYRGVKQVFWILFGIWSVLTPMLFMCLLLSIRESVRSMRISPLAESCRFLWRDYDESMMFWDVIDTLRKLFLTGFIMFIDQEEGSTKLFRLIVANIIIALYISFLAIARPYKKRDDLHLAVISNLLLSCLFASGIAVHLCKEEGGVEEEAEEVTICNQFIGMNLDSYSSSLVALVLVAIMLVVSFGLVGVVLFNTVTVPTLTVVSTGGKPNLDMPRYCTYHLFVSHVWSSGQAKTHAVVRKIQWLLPEIKIWLDTDELKNIGNLEESVAECAIFILYYSKGYFRSTNCRRELFAAMDEQKPTLVIYEGNEYVLQTMKEECMSSIKQELGVPSSQEVLEYLFRYNDPVCWMLEGAFSAISMQRVSKSILEHLPYYEKNSKHLEKGIKVPGQLGSVYLDSPVRVLVCESNEGSREVVEEIMAMKSVSDRSKFMLSIESADKFFQLEEETSSSAEKHTVLLLYLNRNVFNTCKNECRLESVVKRALNQGIDIVLAHEQDLSKEGCNFEVFFQLTPQDLIEPPYQIFNKALGVPLYGMNDFREVGLKQLLCKMGAETKKEMARSQSLSKRFLIVSTTLKWGFSFSLKRSSYISKKDPSLCMYK
jgi:hypothetical protein